MQFVIRVEEDYNDPNSIPIQALSTAFGLSSKNGI